MLEPTIREGMEEAGITDINVRDDGSGMVGTGNSQGQSLSYGTGLNVVSKSKSPTNMQIRQQRCPSDHGSS